MSTIRLDWESPEAAEWTRRLRLCERSTLFQSWSWGAASKAVGAARPARAYIEKNGRPVGLIQVLERTRLGLFTLGEVIRGPLFHRPVMPEDRIAAMVQAAKRYPLGKLKRFSILPELPDGPAATGLMADAGFQRVMEAYETVWLDLSPSLENLRATLRSNFRNQLVNAEKQELLVSEEEDPRPILTAYESHRERARYAAPEASLLAALPDEDLLCLSARRDGALIGGVLIVIHGRAATYQVGWTSEAGRAAHANNLLLWRAVETLKSRDIRHLDLGGLEEDTAPGVAHFKRGMGGEPYRLPGTYIA
jgi:lipid II:glycine glycyltransferase (peptidoglycan interpeptide bridge formation enzyme)